MKRLFDIFASCALIFVFLPLFIIIFLSILFTTPGPVFFMQRRIGLHGHVFHIFKFRTMVHNAEQLGTGLYSFDDDPRITNVGRFLRRHSLDELPQLFNVLMGSMTLVGPRPPVTYELGPWDDYTPEMLNRFTVKPGITGLAQISGRNDLDWDEKIYFDNIYVDRFAKYGVLIDFLILFRTIFVVLSRHNTIENKLHSSRSDSPISARAFDAGIRQD